MLGKLLKHEIRQSGRSVMMVYIAAAAVVLLIGIALLAKITWLSLLGNLILGLVAVAGVLMTLVSVIKTFYDTCYGNQGYLTFTLPVKCSTLLFSKVVTCFIWIILSLVLGAACGAMMVLNTKAMADGDLAGFFRIFQMEEIQALLPTKQMMISGVAALLANLLLSILTFVGFVYFAVTIANTRPLQKHPKLFGFLTFFVSYGICNAIGTKLTYSLPLSLVVTEDRLKIAFTAMDSGEALFAFGLGGTLFMALVALVMLFVTGYIMEHKVNIK